MVSVGKEEREGKEKRCQIMCIKTILKLSGSYAGSVASPRRSLQESRKSSTTIRSWIVKCSSNERRAEEGDKKSELTDSKRTAASKGLAVDVGEKMKENAQSLGKSAHFHIT